MSHTISLDSSKYAKAVVVCNGDFSGKLQFRAWNNLDSYQADRVPDVSVDLPDGLGVPFVKAYLTYKLTSVAETYVPWLLDRLVRL